jgi:hypothetical protein
MTEDHDDWEQALAECVYVISTNTLQASRWLA